jgi:hypothetical protein
LDRSDLLIEAREQALPGIVRLGLPGMAPERLDDRDAAGRKNVETAAEDGDRGWVVHAPGSGTTVKREM